ncbi:hypothetical protein Jden_2184 [Jonesia denitrificans DSM 20603]|uniref:Uncharacterized protein n=2 Tax=Jonesia TaxID=43673 RepID=C7R1I6_JONDD|nr:hypothetical protein Jden_2184 [Jonesia denitrificans DSM 20603]ASE08980.1 hypothetical protein CEP80_07420 [Jonesia denitrificans]SQH22464.1 Uncharacterised protein [Jonesia denitrificans]
MAMPETEATLAVVVARLDDLRADMQSLREEVRKSSENSVTRGEWGQRNQHVDTRINTLGREIGDLRTDVNSRRAPWWSVWAVALAAGGFAWSIIGPVITR